MRLVGPRIESPSAPAGCSEGTNGDSGGECRADPVGAWLGLFGALSGLPRRERVEMQEELSDHLRERVRELMVRGLDEHGAVRAAIEELGGAAEMAARFRSVSANSRRRLAMNISMVGLAGVAAALSVVAVMQPGSGGGSNVYLAPDRAGEAGPLAGVIDLRAQETGLGDVLAFLGESAGVRVNAHWPDLESYGVARDTPVTIDAPQVTVFGALALLADAVHEQIEYRLNNGTLEVAPREYFDRRETVLASYNLQPVEESGVELAEVVRVIESLVEPDGWRDNGGELASAYILGVRLFVEAPPRYHAKVRWIIDELVAGAPAAEGEPGQIGAASGLRRYPLRHAGAAEVGDRLAEMVGGADGIQIHADSRTNSLVLAGDPGVVEAAVISSFDIAKEASAADGEPVIVVVEYDGRREVMSVDSARITTLGELREGVWGRTPQLTLQAYFEALDNTIRIEPSLKVHGSPWIRSLR